MATAAPTLMTADEFFRWANSAENSERHFELERGEVVEMPPPGKYHGFVCANVARILGDFTIQWQRGYVCTNDSGVIVEEDPDTVRAPDVSLFDDDESADDMERKYPADPPLVTVDVLSPDDRISRVVRKAMQLVARGAALVWVVDPEAREVIVYRKDREPEFFGGEDELVFEDVLPGFRCRVGDLFRRPGQPPRDPET
jgi:Uma2 family endonuclease